jgi:hypothetical protein
MFEQPVFLLTFLGYSYKSLDKITLPTSFLAGRVISNGTKLLLASLPQGKRISTAYFYLKNV